MDYSTYKNFEIVIVENNSTELRTFEYYQELKRILKLKWSPGKESLIIPLSTTMALKLFALENIFFLLNNDIEVITPNWIEEMLMFAQREDVGP